MGENGHAQVEVPGRREGGVDVDVWVVRLGRLAARLDELHSVLSEEERRRAGRRYRRDPRKGRYVARQGALRCLLSGYCEVEPADVPIERSARGRPRLAWRRSGGRRGRVARRAEGVEFSVSDSHEIALVAVAKGRALGADVELVRLDRPSDRIARRVLAPADLRRLASESPEERPEAFYRCWTAAEAYAKATGRGLPALIGAAAPAELIGAAPPPEHAGWSLLALDPADGYVASLVVEGSEPSVRVAEWALPARAANDA